MNRSRDLSSAVNAYARANRDRFVGELKQLVSFPSVGAQPKHAGDIRRCAAWLAEHLRGTGLERVRLHGPNEKFHLPNFFNGITTSICFLDALAKMRRSALKAP